MGGTVGNTNSSIEKRQWGNALKRAIAQNNAEKLRRIAEKLIDMAAEGDMQAIKELGDRLDGKAHQTQETALTGQLEVVEIARFADKNPV